MQESNDYSCPFGKVFDWLESTSSQSDRQKPVNARVAWLLVKIVLETSLKHNILFKTFSFSVVLLSIVVRFACACTQEHEYYRVYRRACFNITPRLFYLEKCNRLKCS